MKKQSFCITKSYINLQNIITNQKVNKYFIENNKASFTLERYLFYFFCNKKAIEQNKNL